MTAEPETTQPFIIYLVVPCTACDAAAMQPCSDEGIIVGDDVHLERYQLFASARFEAPEMTLADLKSLTISEYHPDS